MATVMFVVCGNVPLCPAPESPQTPALALCVDLTVCGPCVDRVWLAGAHDPAAVCRELVAELRALHSAMSQQRSFKFYGSSVLLVYDAGYSGAGACSTDVVKSGGGVETPCKAPSVHMIDFGHVWPQVAASGDGADAAVDKG